MLRQDLRDIGARAAAAFKIALGLQLIECGEDRAARKLVLASKLAAGGQLGPRHDAAVENLGAQGVAQPVEGGHTFGTRGKDEFKA